MSGAVVSGVFTLLAFAAAILHALSWRQHSLDSQSAETTPSLPALAIEAGKMLSGQELARMLCMLCLVGAGVASFLSPPWRTLVAFAIFAVPILSIVESIRTRRSVAKQLRLAQNLERELQ